AELAAETGLARSTVAERIDTLLSSGLLKFSDKANSTGGRPPTTVAFNPAARVVLAADIGATHAKLAVTDLAGDVLVEEDKVLNIADGPEVVLREVCDRGRALLTQAERDETDLLGVGIGLPGPVEHLSGKPTNPPIMPGWDGFDVPAFVRGELGAATLVDNDVNIMALGEYRAHWTKYEHMILVKVATGIGSGLISYGRLRRGSQGAAGDMGHGRVPHDTDILCHCGNVGCLEAVASGAAIAAKLTEAGVPAT